MRIIPHSTAHVILINWVGDILLKQNSSNKSKSKNKKFDQKLMFIFQLQSCFMIGRIKGWIMSNFQSDICWTWISYLNFALKKNIWQKLEQKKNSSNKSKSKKYGSGQKWLFIFQPISGRLTTKLSSDWLNQRLVCGLNHSIEWLL